MYISHKPNKPHALKTSTTNVLLMEQLTVWASSFFLFCERCLNSFNISHIAKRSIAIYNTDVSCVQYSTKEITDALVFTNYSVQLEWNSFFIIFPSGYLHPCTIYRINRLEAQIICLRSTDYCTQIVMSTEYCYVYTR